MNITRYSRRQRARAWQQRRQNVFARKQAYRNGKSLLADADKLTLLLIHRDPLWLPDMKALFCSREIQS